MGDVVPEGGGRNREIMLPTSHKMAMSNGGCWSILTLLEHAGQAKTIGNIKQVILELKHDGFYESNSAL